MAYQTGVYNTFNDLLTIIADAARAQGWSVDAQKNNEIYLHNDKIYWSLYNNGKQIYSYLNSGYDASKTYSAQPGSSKSIAGDGLTLLATNAQVVSYDLFVTSDYIHVVVQISGLIFYHFGCGSLIKDFEFDGGGYNYCTNSAGNEKNFNSQVYGLSSTTGNHGSVIDATGVVGKYLRGSSNKILESGMFYALGRRNMSENGYSYHPENYLVRYSQSNYGNMLIPAANSIYTVDTDGFFRRLGIVPDRYECSMVGIIPRQVLEIAGDKWMIIPACHYSDTLTFGSGTHGVAYKIVD